MMSVSATLWALLELLGDRDEIINGVSFLGCMAAGYLILINVWG